MLSADRYEIDRCVTRFFPSLRRRFFLILTDAQLRPHDPSVADAGRVEVEERRRIRVICITIVIRRR